MMADDTRRTLASRLARMSPPPSRANVRLVTATQVVLIRAAQSFAYA
jgi:hypothetical protein